MIAKIVYGETCMGTLNYVFGKEGMQVLGYGNTISQSISPKFFGSVLHFQGQRNATKNRYAHISLNLPHGEHLDDSTFLKISEEYMKNMGYGEQPYVVVRHSDTKHEHVHIVSTIVKEDGKILEIFNSHRRSMAIRQHLEKKYRLSRAPTTKQKRELPIYRLPELQFGMDAEKGTKYYLQDVLNGINQKYMVRSFEELAKLVKPYHIEIKQTKSETGRIGVAYGLNNQKGYRTRFINGSSVHRGLSGPKLQKVFDIHSTSKLLPMHRKRLLKQIKTAYGLFKTIRTENLKEVLREYQDIDIELDKKGETIEGFTVYDRSSYLFQDKELGKNIRIENRTDIFGNGKGPTEIDTKGEQFKLEVQKTIKEAMITSYLTSSRPDGLLSEHIMTRKFGDIEKQLSVSKNYKFLERYIPSNQKGLLHMALKTEFPMVRERLYELETKKEKKTLENKFKLIGNIVDKGVFDVGTKQGSVRLVFQSLGVKYHDNKLSFTSSNRHTVPVPLGHLPFPENMEKFVSTGFVRQNHMMLEMLSGKASDNSPKLTASAIFLPMIFPNLYEKMNPVYKQKYEAVALASYVNYEERMHAPFEKSPKDYIDLFNAKGFYFVKGENGLEVRSIYTASGTSCPLPKRTGQYLKTVPNLGEALREQQSVINGLVENGRDNLENLWAGHLMERGMYNKVAFMLTAEKIFPNLHLEIIQYHMDNGLRKCLKEVVARTTNIQNNRMLRKSVYAISSLLGSRRGSNEMFNGFKDELTDFAKYKNKGVWSSL